MMSNRCLGHARWGWMFRYQQMRGRALVHAWEMHMHF